MNNYSDLDEGKNWIEEQIQDIITGKEIEIGEWNTPDKWFYVGLEIYINQKRRVLKFYRTDIEDAAATPEIKQKLLKYIQEELT